MLLGIVSVINPFSIVYRWGDINWQFCRLNGVRFSDVCLLLRCVYQGNTVSVKSDVSDTSSMLLSGIVWASRVDDVRWAFLKHHVLMKSDVCF
jgi:hypothetical protein